jgi:hypothetical protein
MTSEQYIKLSFKNIGDILRARRLVKIAKQEEKEKLIDKLCTEILPAYLHGGDIDCIVAELDEN